MAPQCGLAPGFISIVAYDLATRFDELRDVALNVLGGKVIVYKHLEHWSITPAGLAHEDATPQELAVTP